MSQPPALRRNVYRSRHRAASHDLAHADPDPVTLVPDHPLIPRDPPTLIDTQAGLHQVIDAVRAAGIMAYDSEFIGEQSYQPRFCVIQIGLPDRIVLIDALAVTDLTPFWALLADPGVEKIVHAGAQDLAPAVRFLNQPPARTLDTQIAAAFLGMVYPCSLSRLVEEFLGVQMGKGLKFSHWDQRPLSASQLHYAANDVRFLPAVRQMLLQRLTDNGNLDLAMQECAMLDDAASYRGDPGSLYLRVRGAESLDRDELAVLRELARWRDEAARLHDLPPRSLLADGILTTLARDPVTSLRDLARVRGLPRPVEQAFGALIVEATARGLATPREDWPPLVRIDESPNQRQRTDALWVQLQQACRDRLIDPAILGSRRSLSHLLRQRDRKLPHDDHPLLRGWRRALVLHALEHPAPPASDTAPPTP